MTTSPLNPRVVQRSTEDQRAIDRETAELALYYYETCAFCIRVIRVLERLRLKVERRNIRNVPAFREQLVKGGGRSTVPCLMIRKENGDIEWLYESQAIIDYLEERFAH